VQLSSEDHHVIVQTGHGRNRFALNVLALDAAAFLFMAVHDSAIFIDEQQFEP
jgi:hypothetical protein